MSAVLQVEPTRRATRRFCCWKLAIRKERWVLTWRGRLLVVFVAMTVGAGVVTRIHPFLAVTEPVDSPILVVEGWISTASFRGAAECYKNGRFDTVYTTGAPMDVDFETAEASETYAAIAAERLQDLGIPKAAIHPVPCWESRRDRTYASAVALKKWLEDHGIAVSGLNVVTRGAHGRRTKLMYEATFGDGVRIGIISIKDREYDPDRWWRYSEGVKAVISETAAYLYARFLFATDS